MSLEATMKHSPREQEDACRRFLVREDLDHLEGLLGALQALSVGPGVQVDRRTLSQLAGLGLRIVADLREHVDQLNHPRGLHVRRAGGDRRELVLEEFKGPRGGQKGAQS